MELGENHTKNAAECSSICRTVLVHNQQGESLSISLLQKKMLCIALILEDLKNTKLMLKHTKFPFKQVVRGSGHGTVGTVLRDSGLTNYLQCCFLCPGKLLTGCCSHPGTALPGLEQTFHQFSTSSRGLRLGRAPCTAGKQRNCRSAVRTDGAENTHYHLKEHFLPRQ